MDWHLVTWLLTVCLSPHWRADISSLLSPAASLSLEQEQHLAQGTSQSPEPKYGTVCRATTDMGIICLSAMSASEDFNSCYVNELVIIIIIIIKYLLYLRDGYVFEVIGSKVIKGQG